MSIKNSIASWYFKQRKDDLYAPLNKANELQKKLLFYLVKRAANTTFGKKYNFNLIKSYKDFAQFVPIHTYEEFSPYIDKMLQGEQQVVWPSDITWFAKSSGTTNSKSKFIPVSKETLDSCHFQGGKDALSVYLRHFPDSTIFEGKGILIGGSHTVNPINEHNFYGDLSAVMMKHLPIWVYLFKTPASDIALMDDWEKKVEKMAQHTIRENVTNISGVPTWTLVLFAKILEITGKSNIHEVWPNLELYVHGGVSFTPYKSQFEKYLPGKNMHYLETYNASEGFIGLQTDLASSALSLMVNYGVFYEFIPQSNNYDIQNIVPLWEVEMGVNYGVVISNNSGLWRYQIGDTIMFDSLEPYTFHITGRTKLFINAFGEELMIDNADKAITFACETHNALLRDYTAAPVYLDSPEEAGHQWLIEFEKEPEDVAAFAVTLDQKLKSLNSDYEAKRHKDLALKMPKIVVLPSHTFEQWLQLNGKLGGQHKVPRLSNNRLIVDEILELLAKSKAQ